MWETLRQTSNSICIQQVKFQKVIYLGIWILLKKYLTCFNYGTQISNMFQLWDTDIYKSYSKSVKKKIQIRLNQNEIRTIRIIKQIELNYSNIRLKLVSLTNFFI